MEPDPSARLRAIRAALQRRFEAREHDLAEHAEYEHGDHEPGEYAHGIARWLVSQLPGSDPRQLGWGILAVAAMLYPAQPADTAGSGGNPAHPGKHQGLRSAMMLASRVAEALISWPAAAEDQVTAGDKVTAGDPTTGNDAVTAEHAAGQGLEVGPELAGFDIFQEFAGLPMLTTISSAQAGPAELRGDFQHYMAKEMTEIRESLAEGLPAADPAAIGWAIAGTASRLLAQASDLPAPGRLRPGARRKAAAKSAAITGALVLAVAGDCLIHSAQRQGPAGRTP